MIIQVRLFAPNDFTAKFGIAKELKMYDPVPKRDGHGNKIARRRAIVLPVKIQGGGIICCSFYCRHWCSKLCILWNQSCATVKRLTSSSQCRGDCIPIHGRRIAVLWKQRNPSAFRMSGAKSTRVAIIGHSGSHLFQYPWHRGH